MPRANSADNVNLFAMQRQRALLARAAPFFRAIIRQRRQRRC